MSQVILWTLWTNQNALSCSPGSTFLYPWKEVRENVKGDGKLLLKGPTIECGSFVGQFNISVVILAKYFASRISPSFPGKQQFIVIPGLCHDLLKIWNTTLSFSNLTLPSVYCPFYCLWDFYTAFFLDVSFFLVKYRQGGNYCTNYIMYTVCSDAKVAPLVILLIYFAVKLFALGLASIPYSYLDPVDGTFYFLCRPQPHCTWSPCWIGERCTEKEKASTKN